MNKNSCGNAIPVGRPRRLEVEKTLRNELQNLTDLMVEASLSGEKERLSIASELRDNIGQTLLLARIKIGMLSGNTNPGEYEALLGDLRNILDRAVWQTRMLSQRLCPPLLLEDGLESALRWLALDMESNQGLTVEYCDDGSEKPLDSVSRSVLFQAAQELLVNVARHAKSGAARLTVDRAGNMFRLLIEDRGVGFDPALFHNNNNFATGRTGLFTVRRRIRSLGGEVVVRSAPGTGSDISIKVPLAQP